MESEARYVLVGSFVAILLVLTIAAVLWLSEVGGSHNSAYFTVYFKHHSLEGLQKDSDVTMKGIKVGSVYEYQISPRTVEEVKVLLRIDGTTPVKVDTKAALRRNLLTGLAWIDLIGSTEESQDLLKIPPGESYPVIPEGRTQIEEIAESIPQALQRLGEMSERIGRLISNENITSLENSLRNIEQSTQAFAERKDDVGRIIDNLDKTLVNIRDTSASLKDFARNADTSLVTFNKDAQQALSSVDSLLQRMDQEMKTMSAAVRSAALVFSQEMTVVSQHVSEAAESFAKTAEGFEDPRSIITGPRERQLGPGEVLER